jgi:hypothetical protein
MAVMAVRFMVFLLGNTTWVFIRFSRDLLG